MGYEANRPTIGRRSPSRRKREYSHGTAQQRRYETRAAVNVVMISCSGLMVRNILPILLVRCIRVVLMIAIVKDNLTERKMLMIAHGAGLVLEPINDIGRAGARKRKRQPNAEHRA